MQIDKPISMFIDPTNKYYSSSKRTKGCPNKRTDYEIYKHKLHTIKKKNIAEYINTKSTNVRWKRELAKQLRDNGVFVGIFRTEDHEPIGWIHTVKGLITLSNCLKQNWSKIIKSRRSILTEQEKQWLKKFGIDNGLNVQSL